MRGVWFGLDAPNPPNWAAGYNPLTGKIWLYTPVNGLCIPYNSLLESGKIVPNGIDVPNVAHKTLQQFLAMAPDWGNWA